MAVKRYNVMVPYSYDHNGEKRTQWTTVGVGFEAKDGEGINIEVRPGLALSGRVIVRPFKQKDSAQAPEADHGGSGFVYRQTPDEELV